MNTETIEPIKTTEPRCPAARKSAKESTDRFLEFYERRITRTLDEHRQLSLDGSHSVLKGQIAYWKNQLQTIKWLRAMNQQRRTHG